MRLRRLIPVVYAITAVTLSGCGMDFCIAGIGPCKFDGITTPSAGSIVVTTSATASTVLINGTATMTASGGTPNYTFSIISGTGTLNPLTSAATSTFTAGTAESCTIVQGTDSTGKTGQRAMLVQPTATTGLSLSSTVVSVVVNGTTSYQATGGGGTYTFSVKNGIGTISGTGATATYTAPSTAGCAIVRVVDTATPTNSAELPLLITATVQ